MDTEDSARALLAAYGQLVGLPTLKFEAHGCARIVFKGNVSVDLEIDRPAKCIQVYGVLGPVPADNREALYRSLLENNLFCTQTRGCTLSIDSVQNEVLISLRVSPETTDPTALTTVLEEFAGNLQEWQQKFQSGELVSGSIPRESMEQPAGMFLRG